MKTNNNEMSDMLYIAMLFRTNGYSKTIEWMSDWLESREEVANMTIAFNFSGENIQDI